MRGIALLPRLGRHHILAVLMSFGLLVGAATGSSSAPVPNFTFSLLGFALLLACFFRLNPVYWTFVRRTKRYTAGGKRPVLIRYAPGIERMLLLTEIQKHCETVLDELTTHFGFSLKRRLIVFLFPTASEVRKPFGYWRATAFAMVGQDAIACSVESLGSHPLEIIRHEIAHLFVAYCVKRYSHLPFKEEGFACYWQKTYFGVPMDDLARHFVRRRRVDRFTELVKASVCDTEGNGWFYAVSGSFTGFLIRQYGWEAYRSFYRSAFAENFAAAFERSFGVRLDEAESHWRMELLGETCFTAETLRRLDAAHRRLLDAVNQVERVSPRPRFRPLMAEFAAIRKHAASW